MRKQLGKRMFAMGLAAALAGGALAGCGSTSTSSATAAETTAATEAASGDAAETGEGEASTEASEASSKAAETESEKEAENKEAGGTAKAGTYSATEKGFGGDVTVTMVVGDDGSVTKVEVEADNETDGIGKAAAPKLAEAIAENQSLAIDAVSGATVTSTAVLAAAETALAEAGIDVDEWKSRQVAKNGEDESVDVDIVIAGAGGGGTGAALAAAQAGAKVLIVEQTSSPGGNTKLSSGFFAMDSSFQQEVNLDFSVDEAVNRILEFNHYLSNGPLTRAVIEKAGDTVDWLNGYGMDFYVQEQTTQFAHEDDPYKYKCYNKYKDTGAGFDAIYGHLEEMGCELRVNTRMTELIQDADGTVTGIKAEKEDGGILTVNAKATIISTGGFGADAQKVEEVSGTAYLNSLGMPNGGEGLAAMVKAGAIDVDATPLLHACQFAEGEVTQVSTEDTLAGYSDSPLSQILESPLLWVDSSGSRFVNEDVVYDTAFWANAGWAAGGKYFIIVDQKTLEDYSNGSAMRISMSGPGANLDPGDFVALADAAVAGGSAYKAASLAELAELAGMKAEELEASVARYNEMVAKGRDTDYNKSAASLLYTVESGDFYAFDCRAVMLGTVGGVRVDEHLEVVNNDYEPIPGLYAAGANAGGYYEGHGYPPYEGMASGFAWTSGRIAGESAAEYIKTK